MPIIKRVGSFSWHCKVFFQVSNILTLTYWGITQIVSMGNRETHNLVLNRSNVPHSHTRGCLWPWGIGVNSQALHGVKYRISDHPLTYKRMSNVCKAWEYYGNCNSLRLKQPPSSYHIGKDAHYRESGNFFGHRNVNVPRRQHPNPNTLRDAPTVRRGKTRAQKCVNDSCIIPQQYTRGCPMSVKLGGNISIKRYRSSTILYLTEGCL